MLSPQPGACLLLFTPSVVWNGWLEMQPTGPSLSLLSRKLHLNKTPWRPCEQYSVRNAGSEDREFPSLGHTCGTEMQSRRLVGWLSAFTLGSGAGRNAVGKSSHLGSSHQRATRCVWAEAANQKHLNASLYGGSCTLSISSTKPAEDAGGWPLVKSLWRTTAGKFWLPFTPSYSVCWKDSRNTPKQSGAEFIFKFIPFGGSSQIYTGGKYFLISWITKPRRTISSLRDHLSVLICDTSPYVVRSPQML